MRTTLTHPPSRRATRRNSVATLALLLMLGFGFSAILPAQPLASGKRQQTNYIVAVSGNYAIAGAQWHDNYKGAAYILKRDGSNWVELHKLSPGDLGRFDHFGGAVAISGDYAVVGATWQDNFKGAVYVFKRNGDNWIEQEKLTAGDGAPDDQFGHTVAISGDVITIGRRLPDATKPNAGMAYRFKRSGNSWEEQPQMPMSDITPAAEEAGQTGSVMSALEGMKGRSASVMALTTNPPAPASVRATDATFEDRVEITWSKVPLAAIVYKILRNGQLLSVVSSDDSLYTDRTGVPGTVYSYCVVVKDMAGLESSPVCDNGSRIIFSPQTVVASDGQFDLFVRITWSDQSQIESGYRIKRNGTLLRTLDANSTLFRDSTAVAGTTYSYQVIAFDASNNESQAVADNGFRGFILPPLNVSATDGQFPDRVRITWTDQATNETGYKIYRDNALIFTAAANATSYEDFTAASGVTYTYCVTTVGAGALESIQVCDAGGRGILPAPTNVSASDNSFDDRVEITWSDPGLLEDGFEISRNGVVLATTKANATSYSDFTAVAGTIYNYCVKAVSNQGGVSAQACDTGVRSPVLAPTQVQATDGTFENRVDITWQSVSTTAVLFKIYRNGTLIKTVPNATRFYSDFGGVAGVTYNYSVKAVTALETESAAAVDAGSRTLKPPTGVAADDDVAENRVLVAWADNSAFEHGYYVYRRALTATDSVLISTREANRTSFLDQTGAPGVTYRYSVAAFDTAGGAPGKSIVGADNGRRTLLAPSNVQATDGTYENRVVITWKDNSNAESGYRVYRGTTLIGTTADNAISFIDNSASVGVTSTYCVAAFDAYGESASASDAGSAALLAPVSVNASEAYTDKVVVTWVDVSQIETGYKVFRAGTLLTTTAANVTSYTDNVVTAGATSTYCVETVSGTAVSAQVCDSGTRLLAPPTITPTLNLDLKLTASDGAASDNFGNSVAISGDYIIIGAPNDDDKGFNSGSAYIYQRNADGSWTQQQKLTASDGAASDQFGYSVSISGDYAIIGAHGDESSKGSAYIFQRSPDGSGWTQQQKLTASDGVGGGTAVGDLFGWSAAISGDYAVIGAFADDDNGDASGSAYIFRRSGSTWTQQQKLTASDGTANDIFGAAVAISGDYVIIGAQGDGAGSAYVFQRSGSTWTQQQKLTANTGGFGQFAQTVAISGDYAIIGDWSDNPMGSASGSAFIFQRSGSTWTQQQKLIPSDGAASDAFGESVAINGDYIIVGAIGDDDKANNAGAAYLFRRIGSTWTQQQKLTASDGGAVDRLGNAVAISGEFAMVGAYNDDNNGGNDAGSAYVLEVVPSPGQMTASDGAFKNRVQIKWQDRSALEDGFRIYRDGQLIETLAPNFQSYSDFEAQPGRTYEYAVAAFRERWGESNRLTDFGWRPADGNITGRIATRAGSAAQGITVCLDPAPNKALLFDGIGGNVVIRRRRYL